MGGALVIRNKFGNEVILKIYHNIYKNHIYNIYYIEVNELRRWLYISNNRRNK